MAKRPCLKEGDIQHGLEHKIPRKPDWWVLWEEIYWKHHSSMSTPQHLMGFVIKDPLTSEGVAQLMVSSMYLCSIFRSPIPSPMPSFFQSPSSSPMPHFHYSTVASTNFIVIQKSLCSPPHGNHSQESWPSFQSLQGIPLTSLNTVRYFSPIFFSDAHMCSYVGTHAQSYMPYNPACLSAVTLPFPCLLALLSRLLTH